MAAGMGSYEWRFDSGRVCLDLVATGEPAPRGAERPERLDRAERLERWLVGSGLVPEGTALVAVDAAWVGRFAELREGIDRLVRAEIEGYDAGGALERVNALAAGAPPGIRAVRDEDGALVRVLVGEPGCGRSSRRSRGTPWTCSPTPPPGPGCGSATATAVEADVSRHLARRAAALVLQRGLRQPRAGRAPPAQGRRGPLTGWTGRQDNAEEDF